MRRVAGCHMVDLHAPYTRKMVKYHQRSEYGLSVMPPRSALLAVLVGLAAVVATGCMRLDVGLVVLDADEVSVRARITMPPLLFDMIGGEATLEEALDLGEILAADIPLDGLGGDLEPFGTSAGAEAVSDSDGWRGIAVETTGPLAAIGGIDLEAPDIRQTESGWHFVWQAESPAPMSGAGDDAFSPDDEGFAAMFEEAFRFTVSVSLPGRLDETNSTRIRTRDGMTTARWVISDLGAPIDFLLVTDTSREAGAGGLGAGAVAGIAAGGGALLLLAGLWWWIRRAERSFEQVDPNAEPSERSNPGERGGPKPDRGGADAESRDQPGDQGRQRRPDPDGIAPGADGL